MRILKTLFFVVLFCVYVEIPFSAKGQFSYIYDNRSVGVSGNIVSLDNYPLQVLNTNFTSGVSPNTAFADLNLTASGGFTNSDGSISFPCSASQTTLFSSTEMSFSSYCVLDTLSGAGPMRGTENATSIFEETFIVSSSIECVLSYNVVQLSSRTINISMTGLALGTIFSLNNLGTVFQETYSGGLVLFSGALEPDTYTLIFNDQINTGFDNTGAFYDYATLTAIPEPSSVAVFCAGLTLSGATWRSRNLRRI